MRTRFLLLATLVLSSCGKKDKDDNHNNADAFPVESDIKWDEPVNAKGPLAEDPSLNLTHRFVFRDTFTMILNKEVNARIKTDKWHLECTGKSRVKGPYYTLEAQDGFYRRTTNSVEDPKNSVPEDAFPGLVPKGIYTLSVTAYSPEPCNVEVSFQFPKPDSDQGFHSGDETMDPGLVGSWEHESWDQGPRVKTTMKFTSERSVSFEKIVGQQQALEYRGKVELDRGTRPMRARIVVHSVFIAEVPDPPQRDSVIRCLYAVYPEDALSSLSWQCQNPDQDQFPVRFDRDAQEFKRVGISQPIGDFRITVSDTPQKNIPDNEPAGTAHKFTIASESEGKVVGVGIQFRVSHPQASDLRIDLEHPDGTSVTLFERELVTGSTLTRSLGLSGSRFAPLDAFTGRSVNGKWALRVSDHVADDTGRIEQAQLILEVKK